MSKYFTTSEVAQSPDSIFWLEKGQTGKTTMEDIQDALAEYKNNYDAGNASKAEILTLYRAFPDSPTYKQAAVGIQKMDMVDPMVIGGPASVEMIDREGHLITTPALSKAFKKFMDNQRTRNVMVLHSDVQVGWALPAYISKGGQIFKSGVGEGGLFFICELRDDTAIAKKVADQISNGLLKSYSIAGSATKVQNMMKGQTPYMQVDEMELAEVTICEKGVNQGAGFELLKAELPQTGKIDKDQCGYRDATAPEEKLGINCGHCKYFNSDTRTCEVVVGDIMPGDYCQLFDAVEEEKPPIQVHRKIVIMRSENTGKINFGDSFLNWMSKNEDPLTSGKSFTTLNNIAGREAEHHRLLQRYGFPSEVDTDKMRYIPVAETETDDDGIPINVKPPWVVNEAGENLGERLDNDDIKKSIDIFEAIIQKANVEASTKKPRRPLDKAPSDFYSNEPTNITSQQPPKESNQSDSGIPAFLRSRNNQPVNTPQPAASASSDAAPFPALTPQGVAAQGASQAAHAENLQTGGPGLARARERSEALTRQVPERQAAAAQQRVEDRRATLRNLEGKGGLLSMRPNRTDSRGTQHFDPIARGRQARTPVEEQGRRQPVQGPAIRYRGGDDTASRNRADAVREARQARGQYVDPDAKDIVSSAQSKGRRDAYENRSAGDRFKQGLKQFGRDAKQQGRGFLRGFKDEKPTMNDERLPEGRGIGRGARRAAEAAGGAFRGFMKPREDVRPDLPVSDQPASVLGETDNRLGAESREKGGQVGRMARQWLGRGARAGKGAVQGFLENPEDARRVGPTKRYTPDEVGATGRQADVAGMRGRGAGAKLRGFLDENVGRGQALAGEGADRIPKYGRNAQQQGRVGASEGLGKDVRYSPTDHQGMDSDQKHNHVQERLDHINQGGNLSPKDWMSVVHHLGQTEDGDRFAQHHSINMKGDDWNKPISFADMRQHLDRNMQVHHGRHGGAGAEAYDGILNRLGDSHEFGREITLKRLRGGRPSMEGLGGGQAQQPSPEEESVNRNQGRRSPNPMDIRGDNPERPPRERGNAGRGRGQRGRGRAKLRQERQARQAGRKAPQQNEQQYYSIENDMPIHKIFAKAFGLAATRR
jgi:hypothetical protein